MNFGDQPNKLQQKIVTFVIRQPFPACRETLTWRAADDRVDTPMPPRPRISPPETPLGGLKQVVGRQSRRVTAKDLTLGEVIQMGSGMNCVVLNGRYHVESGLLEPKTQTAGTREEIDRNWSAG
ncbi:hypothetical protein R4255_17595 [Rhodococcus oxybenzonivorans]|nr:MULTISPECIES: hypothetical protein [Rhodococcus]MDV7244454.1 hypothetical protein [Rhodococcus oxybenzonivorans]MDV7274303.1 hypothetical protein [Rhodococcus oxybenzonivorans]MDV7337811.1 hypothetical protein [Rhodococcus oxybenzonivorans]MDV7345253.1 hypothetical protein [Rhodococcus oxybenzonivorans]MDV8105720.1 hypothetical protein [Rhodococcus sp. IEGM 69]